MGKVIVIGSINMDIVATAARHPHVGETVFGSELGFYAGGKGANQAVAAARAGAATMLLANVGDDPFAADLTAFLTDAGVDASAVHVVEGASSGVALIIVDAKGENSIVVVPGANGLLTPADAGARVTIDHGDVVVAQLEIPAGVVTTMFAEARARGATTVLNPTPAEDVSRELIDLADVLVMNETELRAIAGPGLASGPGIDDVRAAVQRLDRGEGRATVVTLGARGAVAVVGAVVTEVGGRRVQAVDTTGAGDCFVGTLAAQLADGVALEPALGLANVAASISVERFGAGPSMPTIAEVRDRAGPERG